MKKSKIVIVLHAYQPPYPIQERAVINRIIEKSYQPISEKLLNYPGIKLNLNINASLTEILLEEDTKVLDNFKVALNNGQLEFLESGAYHPIFPLLDKKWIEIQIKRNHKINKNTFGTKYNPLGVWSPELAIDVKSLGVLSKMNYKYALVPQNSLPNDLNNILSYIKFNGTKLFTISRNREISNKISFKSYQHRVEDLVSEIRRKQQWTDFPTVLAMDLETFGEHHEYYWNFLFEFLSHPMIEPIFINEMINQPNLLASATQISQINSSSWSTQDDEISTGLPFPLWDNPQNPIHLILHIHFSMLLDIIGELGYSTLNQDQQMNILKSMHSCQWWWADGKGGRWSPSMIRKGFELQRRTLQSIDNNQSYLNISDNLLHRLDQLLI